MTDLAAHCSARDFEVRVLALAVYVDNLAQEGGERAAQPSGGPDSAGQSGLRGEVIHQRGRRARSQVEAVSINDRQEQTQSGHS